MRETAQVSDRNEVYNRIEQLNKEIADYGVAIEYKAGERTEMLRLLSNKIGDDYQGMTSELEDLLLEVSKLNNTMKALSDWRRTARRERNRLMNAFTFTEPEVLALIDLVGNALDNDPHNTMLHEILTELDTITEREED